MVKPHYMLAKPPGPSRARTLINQRLVPALINLCGASEGALERVAGAVRRSPALALAAAASAGALLSASLGRARPR